MLQKKETIEIIIPIYNEQDCIDEMIERLFNLRRSASSLLEMSFIFINDGSEDKSLEMLIAYSEKHDCIKLISFSKNFGHQIALTAGIDYSTADYVAIIDADLQDPPELIMDMYHKAKEGYDVVYGQRLDREGESFFKKFTAKMFYRLINRLCDVKIPMDTADFRLMNKKVVKSLTRLREQHRFIRGMIPWMGFKSVPIHYHRQKRYAGETKYPFKKMLYFALNGIFSFSNTPLRLATVVGLITAGFGGLGGVFVLGCYLFTDINIPGITATILSIVTMGGIQIIMLGIIGEYLGRIFEESKKRPLYIIEDIINIDD